MCVCVCVEGKEGTQKLRIIVFVVVLVFVQGRSWGRWRDVHHGGVGGEGHAALRLR